MPVRFASGVKRDPRVATGPSTMEIPLVQGIHLKIPLASAVLGLSQPSNLKKPQFCRVKIQPPAEALGAPISFAQIFTFPPGVRAPPDSDPLFLALTRRYISFSLHSPGPCVPTVPSFIPHLFAILWNLPSSPVCTVVGLATITILCSAPVPYFIPYVSRNVRRWIRLKLRGFITNTEWTSCLLNRPGNAQTAVPFESKLRSNRTSQR